MIRDDLMEFKSIVDNKIDAMESALVEDDDELETLDDRKLGYWGQQALDFRK